MPDVLAYPLEEARRMLEAEGLTVEVVETRPPGGRAPAGPPRVVRQRQEGDRVVLTVTHERYTRIPDAPGPERPPAPPR